MGELSQLLTLREKILLLIDKERDRFKMRGLSILFVLPLLLCLQQEAEAICPPCPAPPVHACCGSGDVMGTCCQANETCCLPSDPSERPHCAASIEACFEKQ